MALFLSTAVYLLDDKNRVPMPPKYRPFFDGPAFLTSGKDPCIEVYTQDDFESAASEVKLLPKDSPEGREARRKFFSDGDTVMKDSQGRLLIPGHLIAHARLVKDVVVAGAGDWFEIWDKTMWESRNGAVRTEG